MTEKIFKMIKDNEVKFVDFRFTDPRGKWQHTAQTVESVDEDLLTKGIMFLHCVRYAEITYFILATLWCAV